MKKYMCKKYPQSISLIIFLFSSIIYSFPNSDRFTKAYQAESAPIIDGDVLNDPAWESIPAITTFTQKTPDEGEPISERTVVKIMYSEKYFFGEDHFYYFHQYFIWSVLQLFWMILKDTI